MIAQKNVADIHYNCLLQAIPLNIHTVCFLGEIKMVFPKISPNTPFQPGPRFVVQEGILICIGLGMHVVFAILVSKWTSLTNSLHLGLEV